MPKNMYNFTGPLDPREHRLVCNNRSKEIDKVKTGLLNGDYWVILGPRQIGKTTFLYQVKNELSEYPSVYVDLSISPEEDEAFYRFITAAIREGFTEQQVTNETTVKENDMGYQMNFYNFLKNFRPGKDKKIILFFDEIEKTPSVSSFLNTWRKVFHERMDHHELKKYALVIAGSVDLIPLTIGPTSPFNIARKLYLDNLSERESGELIDEPFEELGLKITEEGREKIIAQTSGHPQLLQHLCHALVERAWEERKEITAADVENAIEEKLYIESDNLKTLEQQISEDATLKDLVTRLLNEEEVRYTRYHNYSLAGIGPIVNHGQYCAIRNEIYREFLYRQINPDPQKKMPQSREAQDQNQYQANRYPTEKSGLKLMIGTVTSLSGIMAILSIFTESSLGIALAIVLAIFSLGASLKYWVSIRKPSD